MTSALASILSRRMLIITGKGGTGKTTLAAALGVLAARTRLDTIVVEMGDEAALPRLLGATSAADPEGREPIRIAPHLYTLRIVPQVALTEYLELQLRVRAVAGRIVRNAAFSRFLDAAPGWRELITLGKLWHLTSLVEEGRPKWPLLIVDAPATGHGLSLLSAPKVVVDTVRMGPLRRHTELVQDLLHDARKTLVLPVSLAEELPVNETIELCARVRELGLAIGPIFANGIETAPELPELDAVLHTLAELTTDERTPPLAEPTALHQAVMHRLLRSRMHRGFIDRLGAVEGEGCHELPYLVDRLDEPSGIAVLADRLEAVL